jgi:hypothetical protein
VKDVDEEPEVEPCTLELCETDPPELWLLAELEEELEPPEELLWDPPPLDPPELPPPPEECCANVAEQNSSTAATHRLECRIVHLLPTDPMAGKPSLDVSIQQKDTPQLRQIA